MSTHRITRMHDTVYCSCGRSWDHTEDPEISQPCIAGTPITPKPIEVTTPAMNLYRFSVVGPQDNIVSVAVYDIDLVAAERAVRAWAPQEVLSYLDDHDHGLFELRTQIFDYAAPHVVMNPVALAALNESFPGNNIVSVRHLAASLSPQTEG